MNIGRRSLLGFLAGLIFASRAFAAADASTLELPRGVDVALVVFEDLQCPDCARAHPQLMATSKSEGVPLVIHDFPITRHAWAFPAAILARWFTLQSPQLGTDFRSFIFEHQRDIDPSKLRAVAEQFAQARGVTLPEQIDADGKLMTLVQADFDLGVKIGLQYVPLIFVVTRGAGWVEVTDTAKLPEAIAEMKRKQSAAR